MKQDNIMAKAKKKLLPKSFEDLIKGGDLDALKAVFEACDVNARGGFSKQTAIAFNECPDQLVRWLFERGADISAEDSYGETPLHARARHWQGRIDILLELGADVNHGEGGRGTPLHSAAGAGNVRTARLLLQNGARVGVLNSHGQTPLAYALMNCSNAQIERIADIAALLIEVDADKSVKSTGIFSRIFGSKSEKQAAVTSEMKASVARIGEDFEFHRSNFNPESVDATSAALDRLYALFDVTPVPRRVMHDGKSGITPKAEQWEDQHDELWEMLVPSSGAAATIQGEVIRISGKISYELNGNGGINWDADYKKMADAFLLHISSGSPLSDVELAEVRSIVAEVKAKKGDMKRMCELAVHWVSINPKPKKLPAPNYTR
jgi:hypothetical protein